MLTAMAHIQVTEEYEKEAEEFYKEFLQVLVECKLPFLVGGTYAVKFYTEIIRPTKDIDVFCKAGDYPKILKVFQDQGYEVQVIDDRWLAKVTKGKYFADIIFGGIPATWPINDEWIENATTGEILGYTVKITPVEELILSKMYRQGRNNYDGADVTHLILKEGKNLDWKRLLNHAEPNWEVLLAQIIMFRFVYPSDRNSIPRWLLEELLGRVSAQLVLPEPEEKVCRGSLLSHTQYQTAYTEWGYKDVSDFFHKGEYYSDPSK